MLKRLKWPSWAVIFVFIAGIYYFISSGADSSLQAFSRTETTSPAAFPGLNLETRTKETKSYTLAISTPITKFENLNKPMKDWIQAQESEFLKTVKANRQLMDSKEFRAHLNIKAEPKKISDTMYTLVFEAYRYSGGANGQAEVKTFTVDIGKQKMVQLEDVIHMDEESLATLRTLIKNQMGEKEELQDYLFEDFLDEALENPLNWKWALSGKHFTLYFNEYEIAAGAAGAVKVKVPIEQIRPLLKDEIIRHLELPDIQAPEPEVSEPETAPLDPAGKYIALTFDDGPHPKVTPLILDILKKHNAKATFYMLGSQAQFYPALASQVAEEGHEIGNHSNSHADLSSLGAKEIRKEMEEASAKIKEASGQLPATVRPPYGAMNEDVKKIAGMAQTPLILWSVDSLDWKTLNAQSIKKIVKANAVPGSIVLMHDIHMPTAQALPELLTYLEKEGYEFITVSQLLSLQEQEVTGTFFGKRS
ncbi:MULTISPECIES: polysaccharide deacetylase family protein [unclassified Cytobacillus]|uniref:polysaccharide deacetylase family protein n=1 Tax=unclassified Cytobacillus TaxID=2675268 RepID=UPI00203B9EA1|nr:polysaccharide deacetylase family protein [Cytobacillus sp. AMY 15.2]MCM3090848.1 polysaccharide deacetylase family protein [Cytobacillus sp. AMY 15.2]